MSVTTNKSITPDDLEQHRLWRITDGAQGKRIERVEAYLFRANLSGAYLSGANLSGAYLSGANLSGAYLIRGLLIGDRPVLQLIFDHDWSLIIFNTNKGIVINCGCRWFESPDAARKHWWAHADEQRRRVVIPALDALLSVAKAQGWEDTP